MTEAELIKTFGAFFAIMAPFVNLPIPCAGDLGLIQRGHTSQRVGAVVAPRGPTS